MLFHLSFRELVLPIIEPRFSNLEHQKKIGSYDSYSFDGTGILSLPEKLLTKIFLHFPRNFNLQNVGLVCRRFLKVVTLPIFVPYKNITHLDEDEESSVFKKQSLVEIRNVLKIYPECKLKLSLSRGGGEHDPSPMISFKRLEPFLLNISEFSIDIGHCKYFLNDNLSLIPTLINLEKMYLALSMFEEQYSSGVNQINEVEDSFWGKFPNLVSLSIGIDLHDDSVSTSLPFVSYSKYFVLC